MTGHEERRKIARKLRAAAVYLPNDIDSEDLEMAIATTVCNYDVPNVETLLNRLADLVEPEPERTCRMVSAFDTDELENIQENISFSPEDTLAYRCEGCGFDFRYERGLYPSYCPNCGARVKEDDDGNE